ncbi:MAG: right-handed parallel beta-helix repeat-containing protein [Thermaurantiacus sp.]|nr:right-handed parallel beta-helix repeat-containing protein [Thermaurantiacus sp.]
MRLAVGALLAFPPLSPTGARAAVFPVSDAQGLAAAVAAARAGDTIELATADYGLLRIDGRQHEGPPVQIRPASGARPRFSGVVVAGSSGWALYGLAVLGPRNPLVAVNQSTDIRLGGFTFTGATPNKDAWDDENTGLYVRNSSRVTVTNSRFADLRKAAFFQRSQRVILADCTVEWVREGLNIAAMDRMLVRRNLIRNIQPNYAKDEHPDAIQFWTTNETTGSSNVAMADNYLALGGPRAVQGFFVAGGGEAGAENEHLMHVRIEVRNNVYFGSAANSLRFGGVRNGYILRNTVVSSAHGDREKLTPPDDTGRTSGGQTARIWTFRNVNTRIERNLASHYGSNTGQIVVGNLDIIDPKFGGQVAWTDVLPPRSDAEAPPVAAFRILPGSVAHVAGVGASLPSRVGQQTTRLEAVVAATNAYHAQLDNPEAWFTKRPD